MLTNNQTIGKEEMKELKVLELFGGIGAFTKALERQHIPHKVVDYVDIDKYAVKSYNAMHGTSYEPQDIKEWDKDLEVDVIMHGSPCQDFSVAGKGAGGDAGSGTRSSLMYETLRIVEKLKPEYVIWENVKNLLSKKHRHNYFAYIEAMNNLGYKSYGRVLNAKDYGIPQNRERVYTVSIRERERQFEWPEPMLLERRLGDMLEETVDEKYYLSEDRLKGILKWEERQKENGRGFRFDVKDGDGIARTMTTSSDRPADSTYVIGRIGESGYDQNRRIYSKNGLAPTLTSMTGGDRQPKIVASRGRGDMNKQQLEPRKDSLTNTITSVQKDNYVVEDFYKSRKPREYHETAPTLRSERQGLKVAGTRIRRLTPKECWRLMGFDDEDFEKAKQVNSDTQLYKQAGNSIVVNVLEGIVKNLFTERR